MKISVADARALAAALHDGAEKAMAEGNHEVELVSAVQAVDNAAREELQKAIEAARAG